MRDDIDSCVIHDVRFGCVGRAPENRLADVVRRAKAVASQCNYVHELALVRASPSPYGPPDGYRLVQTIVRPRIRGLGNQPVVIRVRRADKHAVPVLEVFGLQILRRASHHI